MSLPREVVAVTRFFTGGDVLPNLSGSLSRDLTESGGLKWNVHSRGMRMCIYI